VGFWASEDLEGFLEAFCGRGVVGCWEVAGPSLESFEDFGGFRGCGVLESGWLAGDWGASRGLRIVKILEGFGVAGVC
jgi:hypothetical protein